MTIKKRILGIAVVLFALSFPSIAEDENYIVHLPDGTEIKIENKKAYYRCKGKDELLPDGAYLLADGCKLTVKNLVITELTKNQVLVVIPAEAGIS